MKYKMVKTNDKIWRFGVFKTPLLMKTYQIMQITAFNVIVAQKINLKGSQHYENTFARMESDCTLLFGFK